MSHSCLSAVPTTTLSFNVLRPLYLEEDLDAAMSAMDTDGGGTVDFDEFTEWWEAGALPALLAHSRGTTLSAYV